MKVFSFIAPQNLQNWSGDAKQFFNYLEKNQGYPASQQNLIGALPDIANEIRSLTKP